MVTTSDFVIGLDLDNVSCDWQRGWRDAYWLDYGEYILDTDINEWTSCTDKTKFKSMTDLYAWLNSKPSFWADLKPVAGALGAIRDMLLDGFKFQVVTSRPNVPTVERQTEEWLIRHWPVTSDELWHKRDLPDIHWYPSGHKQEALVDLFIDDDPHTIEQIALSGKRVMKLVCPWNEKVKGSNITPVVWRQVHDVASQVREMRGGLRWD